MFRNMYHNIIKIILILGVLAVALFARGNGERSLAAFTQTVEGGTGCFTVFLPVVARSGGNSSSETLVTTNSGTTQLDCGTDEIVDFNGDGYADLAIGIPYEDKNGLVTDSGAVQILYGTANGLSVEDNQIWTQVNIFGVEEKDDQFGWVLAAGDFNGDGVTDLAVSAPGETRDGLGDAGEVNIIYGYPTQGLTPNGTQTFAQGYDSVAGALEENDRFGESLISGDFNNDGYDDLAIGTPDEGLESEGLSQIGAVNVIYGSELGLQTANDIILHLGLETVDLEPSALDHFGRALDSADFNGDGYDDLAVGIPGYNIVGADSVGAIMVFNGSDSGISFAGETAWRQGFNGVQGSPEAYDRFGASLSAGDFNDDGIGDLAIGSTGESVLYNGSEVLNAGAINILYGSTIAGGLTGSGDQIFHRGQDEILGTPEEGEIFGYSLMAADFNGDGADDLAIGVPFQDGIATDQGFTVVLYSNGSILDTSGQDLWTQGVITGAPEDYDYFGVTLTAGDYDGNGSADLIVGVPSEGVLRDAVNYEKAGALNAIYGFESGLGVTNNQIWYQDIDGIPDTSEAFDYFAWGLGR